MSSGQRARTPANFPRMRYRAWSRNWRRHSRADIPAGLFWWTLRTGTQPIPDRGPFAGCTRSEAVALQAMARTLHAAGVPGVEHLAHHPLPGDEDTEYGDIVGVVDGAPWAVWVNPFIASEVQHEPPRSLPERVAAFDRARRAVADLSL